jgi:hypothetical protein
MSERLYPLRNDQGNFETGVARGKQVLMGNTVHEIVAHWFDMEGRFLGLERFHMGVDPPTFPGTTIYQTGSEYHRQVDVEVEALKQHLGFVPADIRVRAFDSDEAGIVDLPGEYEEFLQSPESYSPEDRKWFEGYIKEWRAKGQFALYWHGEFWLSAEGQVLSSP